MPFTQVQAGARRILGGWRRSGWLCGLPLHHLQRVFRCIELCPQALNRPDLHFEGAGNGPVVITLIGRGHKLYSGASPISLVEHCATFRHDRRLLSLLGFVHNWPTSWWSATKKENRFLLNGNGIMSSFIGWQFYRSTLYTHTHTHTHTRTYIYIYIYIYIWLKYEFDFMLLIIRFVWIEGQLTSPGDSLRETLRCESYFKILWVLFPNIRNKLFCISTTLYFSFWSFFFMSLSSASVKLCVASLISSYCESYFLIFAIKLFALVQHYTSLSEVFFLCYCHQLAWNSALWVLFSHIVYLIS